jgi:hypothetical protein
MTSDEEIRAAVAPVTSSTRRGVRLQGDAAAPAGGRTVARPNNVAEVNT